MKKIKLWAAMMAAVLCLAGCGGSGVGTTTAAPETTAAETTKAPETEAPTTEAEIKEVVSYKIDIPEGFVEQDPGEGLAFYCAAEDSSNINMNIQGKDPGFGLVTGEMLHTALEAVYGELMETEVEITDLYFTQDPISGYPAYQYALSYEVMGVPMNQLIVGIDADATYTFTYTDVSGSGQWMEIFKESAKNIKLITE